MIVTITKNIEVDTNKIIVNLRKSLRETYPLLDTNDDQIMLQILTDMTAKVQRCTEFNKRSPRT